MRSITQRNLWGMFPKPCWIYATENKRQVTAHCVQWVDNSVFEMEKIVDQILMYSFQDSLFANNFYIFLT